ncbi:MAG: phospholipase D-like domain-containing protein [Rubritalea sp.]|uniref:phospholipase D-like domain-containing protein n=1 Tax=Rubritalea sp. TaxID=2109375 RepID=UPI003242356E
MVRYLLCALTLVGLVSCAKLDDSPFAGLGKSAPALMSEAFDEAMEKEAQALWLEGSQIDTLVNGGEYFPAMLEAVRSAQKTITFETFVAVDGHVTYDLVMAMSERAQAGVRVHVILDGVGSMKLDERYLIALRNAGVEVELYRPFNCFRLFHGNNRDHRKILVVDGDVAFTGGAGYADCWNGGAKGKWQWRDTMYRVRGPLVAELQRGFMNNWAELRGDDLNSEAYFPKLKELGDMKAQVVLGAPCERGDTLGAGYLLAIDAAKKSILIEHAYFIPNKQLRRALVRAMERGVEVDIILPNDHIDTPIVRQTSMLYWPELLQAGAKIYEFQPSMMHGKLIVVDDELSIIGSGNFDDRTFFINDEINVHVLSKRFASEQRRMFENDLKNCVQKYEEDAKARLGDLPRRWVGKLLEPQL